MNEKVGVGVMGVLLNITMAKSFFGGKYLVNTEYGHKKPFSLILTAGVKTAPTLKLGPKNYFFSLSKCN